jgi:eukaryotic-like serine/threonine-protein kinase
MDSSERDVACRFGNGMNPTTTLLLPEDVLVAPVAKLPAELSRRVVHEPDDFFVTRSTSGSECVVIDADTAALLAHFRSQSTILDAIVAFCRANALDPMRTLDDAFATLTDLVAARVLVPAESNLAQPVGRTHTQWQSYRYCEIYRTQFSEDECRAIVSNAR